MRLRKRHEARSADAVCWARCCLHVRRWALPTAARAEYPDKPIRLIVPQAAGSATDTVARILAAELGPRSAARPSSSRTSRAARSRIGMDYRRQVGARRLHARHRADRRAGDHPPHGGEAALCHREGLPADRADRARASDARGVAEVGHQIGEGADREGQGQSRQAHQRVVEQRLARPCRRRAVQVHDRDADPARAVPRRRAGDQRPGRRARRSDVREPQLDLQRRQVRPGAGRSR